MSDLNDKRKELAHREQQLEERERAIRLAELEQELYQPKELPLYPTQPHQPKPGKLKRLYRKIVRIAKFLGFTIVGIAAIQLGAWIAGLIILAGIVWLAYTLFLDSRAENNQ